MSEEDEDHGRIRQQGEGEGKVSGKFGDGIVDKGTLEPRLERGGGSHADAQRKRWEQGQMVPSPRAAGGLVAAGERVEESGEVRGQWDQPMGGLGFDWWVDIWMDSGEEDISGCINGCTRAQGGVHVCVRLSLALKLASQDRYLTSTQFPAPEACPLESACWEPSTAHPMFHQVPSPPPGTSERGKPQRDQTHMGWEPCKTHLHLHHQPRTPPRLCCSLGLDFQIIVAGVAHLTEAGHKEVIAPMVGWGVLLDVGKLHKLPGRREGFTGEVTTVLPAF